MVATPATRSKPKPTTPRLPKPTSRPRPTNAPRPATRAAYKPRITFLSASDYVIPSERYGGHVLYLVTVTGPDRATCECTAGQFGKPCKHAALALAIHAYRQHPSHLRPAIPEGAAVVPTVAPITRPSFTPAPPAFSELFAA